MNDPTQLLSAESRALLVSATNLARRLGAPTAEVEHVLVEAMRLPDPKLAPFGRCGLSAVGAEAMLMAFAPPQVRSERPPRLGRTVAHIVRIAGGSCEARQLVEIPPVALAAAALTVESQAVALLATRFTVDVHQLINELLVNLDSTPRRSAPTSLFDQDAPAGREPVAVGGRTTTSPASGPAPKMLAQFGRDLVAAARNGELTPTVGRGDEISRMIGVLCRRSRSNPVVVGDAGVGKTAVVEGLAARVAAGEVPDLLANVKIWQVDLGAVIAGTTLRGDMEKRAKALLAEVAADPSNIVFFDEIHAFVGAGAAGGSLSLSEIFKPALARGELRIIGATTMAEYRRYFEADAALTRRFTPIEVTEPSGDDLHAILSSWVPTLAAHHGVTYTEGTVASAARLARRHLSDRQLPDSAVDLLDEAGALVAMARRHAGDEAELVTAIAAARAAIAAPANDDVAEEMAALLGDALDEAARAGLGSRLRSEVTVADIEAACADKAGLDVGAVSDDETVTLLNLDVTLGARVIGQDHAVDEVSRSLRRRRSPFAPARPAALLFAGPTGVGKTELAKAVADAVGSTLVTIDCSEYQERHSVSRLIGSPPGYVGHNDGGQLTEALRRNPGAVVLFDEVEKADPRVFDILLSLLEEGRVTDSRGRKVDASSAVFILTSNLGTQRRRIPGFTTGDTAADADRLVVLDAVKAFFRVELLNRLDEVVVFRRLDLDNMRTIVGLLLERPLAQLADLGVAAQVTDAAVDLLATRSFDDELGARPARRAITQIVENRLATELLAGTVTAGDTVVLDVDADGELTFTSVPTTATTDSRSAAGTV